MMDSAYNLSAVLDCLAVNEPSSEQLDAAWQALERASRDDEDTLDDWLMACSALRPTSAHSASPKSLLLERLIEVLHQQSLRRLADDEGWFEPLLVETVTGWYRHLGRSNRARAYLLSILAREGSREAMDRLAECLVEDPPGEMLGVDLVFATLFQRRSRHTALLFPRVLEALDDPDVAPDVLDLANFLFREGYVELHPAAEIQPRLCDLLGGIVANLSRIEAGHYDDSRPADVMQQQVLASIGLGVSICDCLALTQYEPALPCVSEAMDLGHRRLRCEAAWTLARLGDERGVAELVQLAEEPIARLRVLAYAEELGILEQIADDFQTGSARAEAELVVWLAQPSQMGLAPTKVDLIEQASLAWPGYEEPLDCYLFRFTYDLGRGTYTNVGIAGPVTRAVTIDLLDLAPHDIFAFYAGLTTQHDEIQEQPVEELAAGYDAEIARLERRLRDEGLDQIQPRLFGMFFGDRVLIADATKSGQGGVAVTDRIDVFWLPYGPQERPLGPSEAFALYKGRKLLRAFNPVDDSGVTGPGQDPSAD